ncbi:MAG: chemotaxis protein CheW, partial [Actinomycetota bacterium]|nr:chemotaxis protein CheW [Actinomycetota bacterium]
VVDLRTRLGLPRTDRDERQRIVVLIIGGVRTGFIVDSVAEVGRIGRQVLEPAPQLSAEQARVVSRVANLPDQKRMLLLVQVEELLAADQARDLEAVLDDAADVVLEPA